MDSLFFSSFSPLKRLYKFVLKKLIGQFLTTELNVDQLDVALTTGEIELRNLDINVTPINELCHSLPIRMVTGAIGIINIHVPWRKLLTHNCQVKIKGLELVIAPIIHLPPNHPTFSTPLSASALLHQNLVDSIHSLADLNKKKDKKKKKAERLQRRRKLVQEQIDSERNRRRKKRRNSNNTGKQQLNEDTDTDNDSEDDSVSSADDDVDELDDVDYEEKKPELIILENDITSSGLKLVASFLERIISRTEVTMEDVTVRIECPVNNSEQITTVSIHIPSLTYTDLHQQSQSSSSSSVSRVEPSFEYDKAIRFHGFQVELTESGPDELVESLHRNLPMTIAVGDVGKDCLIRLKIKMDEHHNFRVDSSCFIESIRALLSPYHLSLLLQIAHSITQSSSIAARQMQLREQMQIQEKPDFANPLVNAEKKSHSERNDVSQPPIPQYTTISPSSQIASSTTESFSLSELWSVTMEIKHSSLVLLQEDEPLRKEWWLERIRYSPLTSERSSIVLLSPMIAGISVDHLLLSLDTISISLKQTSIYSTCSIVVKQVKAEEYLQQMRLMISTIPSIAESRSISNSQSTLYEKQQQRMGFRARPLIEFQNSSLSGAADSDAPPHFKCDIISAVNAPLQQSQLPPIPFITSELSGSVDTRVHIQVQPFSVDIDLGLASRLEHVQRGFSSSFRSFTNLTPSAALTPPKLSSSSLQSSNVSSDCIQVFFSIPSFNLTLWFPADTTSQSNVETIVVNDSAPGCFDSRGVMRCERLSMELSQCVCWHQSEKSKDSDLPVSKDDEGDQWNIQFGAASIFLLYPKHEQQETPFMKFKQQSQKQFASSDHQLSDLPSNSYSKRILSTKYSATPSFAQNRSSSCSSGMSRVTIFHRTAASTIADENFNRNKNMEEMFLDSLPNYRAFEPSNPNNRTSEQPSPAFSSSSSSTTSSSPASSVPDAALFERLAIANSSVVVSIELCGCNVHLSKVELDLLILLYTIFDEIFYQMTNPQSLIIEPSVSAPLTNTSARSNQPSDAKDSISADNITLDPSAVTSVPSSLFPIVSNSDSDSDSDSDVSELFQSVIETDSVIIQPLVEDHPHHQQGLALSDADSDELEDLIDEESKAAAEYNKQFGIQSVILGTSQELARGNRRVVDSNIISPLTVVPRRNDKSPMNTFEKNDTSSSSSSSSSSSLLLDSTTESNSQLFHSFVSYPHSLLSSTVLPDNSSFVPADKQPHKYIRDKANAITNDSKSSPSLGLRHKHLLSLRLSIKEGGVCFQEEPVPLPLFSILSPFDPVQASSLLPPQSFYLDLVNLQLFLCNKFDGEDLSYVSVRIADGTLREYHQVIEDEEKWSVISTPLLFKTMQDQQTENHPVRKQSMHTSVSSLAANESVVWSNPVFVGNFIISLNSELHLRETTAILNLRALTLQYSPYSDWLLKLSDFFCLTVPPYVQAIGPAVKLTSDYSNIAGVTSVALEGMFSDSGQQLCLPPLTQDLVKLFLHCYDCCFDYNPDRIQPRAVLSLDHLHLNTIVYPDTRRFQIIIEVRDAALFLLPSSSKVIPATSRNLRYLSSPYFHHIVSDSFTAYLEELGFARVMTLDYLDVNVIQQDPLSPSATDPMIGVEMTNGMLNISTCYDSFGVLLDIATCLSSCFIELTEKTKEQLKINIPLSSNMNEDQPLETSKQQLDGQPLQDAVVDDDEEKKAVLGDAADDLAVNSCFPLSVIGDTGSVHFIDDYDNKKQSSTSVSLALQAAAERAIAERNQRERELNYSRLFSGFSQSSDYPILPEQSARWFSKSELDQREAKSLDHHLRHHSNYIDDVSQRESEELLEQELDADRQRRRLRQQERGKQLSKKHQPIEPVIIDNHISKPESDDDDFTASKGVGSGGTAGIRAMKRFKLLPAEDTPVPYSQLILYDFNLCWTIFDGNDWRTPEPHQHHNGELKQSDLQQNGNDPGSYNDVGHIVHDEEAAKLNHLLDEELKKNLVLKSDRQPPHSSNSTPSSDDLPSEPIDEDSDPDITHSAAFHPYSVSSSLLFSSSSEELVINRRRSLLKPDYIALVVSPAATSLADAVSTKLVTPPIPRGDRDTERVMEIHVNGIQLLQTSYAIDNHHSLTNRVSFALSELEIHDCILTSRYRKFLCYHRTHPAEKMRRRDKNTAQIKVEMSQLKPTNRPAAVKDEIILIITCLPFRLNIDQDAVEFFICFFSHPVTIHQPDLGAKSNDPIEEKYSEDVENENLKVEQSATHKERNGNTREEQSARSISASEADLMSNDIDNPAVQSPIAVSPPIDPSSTVIRHLSVTSSVTLCIDYKPKRVNYSHLRSGDYAQLVHLFPIENLTITLQQFTTNDVVGWDVLAINLLNHWMADITHNQLHHYLASVQPLRSLVNVGTGVVDCVLLPYDQYKQQGRIFRGMKKGAWSLIQHVTMESMNVAMKVAQSAQSILETVEDVINHATREKKPKKHKLTQNQQINQILQRNGENLPISDHMTSSTFPLPLSLRDGLSLAYDSLSRSFNLVAHQMLVIPRDDYARYGGRVAVTSVVRSVPSIVLRPMIGATEAIRNAILGIQTTIDQSKPQEWQDKYKGSGY